MNKRRKKIVTIVTVLCLCLLAGIRTLAADGSITYGSSSYSATQGETFQVGVYVNGSEAIGAYEFYLDYSADMLEYVSGADGGGIFPHGGAGPKADCGGDRGGPHLLGRRG